MKLSFSEPGVAFSGLAHVGVLALLLLNLSWCSGPIPDDDVKEAVPIETISTKDFNQIMKGEKSSTDATKQPSTRVDKVAQVEEQHKEQAKPDVTKEVPTPPPPPTPPVPTPPEPPKPVTPPPPTPPAPPQRPDPTPPPPLPPVAPTPPAPKAAPPAPTPPIRDPEAEVIRPAPTPPHRPEPPKPEVKPVPKPPDLPRKTEVKPPPTPPQPPKPKLDQLAKVIEETPEPRPDPPRPVHKPVVHAKPAPPVPETPAEAQPTQSHSFDLTDISKLLNSEPAAAPASTGRVASKTASRGAASGTASTMSPNMWDALDGLMQDQYKQCWSYLGLDHGKYIPQIKVAYAEDGSLVNEPVLINKPSDPALRSLAESALRAVRQCNPLKIPAQFAPFYDQWKGRVLRFDPAEMAG